MIIIKITIMIKARINHIYRSDRQDARKSGNHLSTCVKTKQKLVNRLKTTTIY